MAINARAAAAADARRGVQLGAVSRAQQAQQAQRQQVAAVQQAQAQAANPYLGIKRPGQKNKPAEDKGLIGNILGNSIVKGVLKPLEVLDLGRRIVLSGLKEGADIAGGKPGADLFGNKTDEASWSDFMAQVKDPEFGFGDIVGNATGNKWADRLIGFAGDVALDPLTYLTLGTSKLAGLTGRGALAQAAAKSTKVAPEVVDDLIRRSGRFGPSALTRAELEMLDMPRAGLRFKPLLGPEMRIPGTERIAEGLQKATTAGRLRLTDTALGRTARKLGAGRSEELREAYEALALGGTPTMSPRTGANMIRKIRAGQLAGRGVSHAAEREAVDLGTKLRDNVDFTHAYEEGLDDGRRGRPAQGDGRVPAERTEESTASTSATGRRPPRTRPASSTCRTSTPTKGPSWSG